MAGQPRLRPIKPRTSKYDELARGKVEELLKTDYQPHIEFANESTQKKLTLQQQKEKEQEEALQKELQTYKAFLNQNDEYALLI